VGHYSRVLGRRRDRAFPRYLFGLSYQRAVEQAGGQVASGDVAAHHRTAVKALALAEALAPGWLNLAAAKAVSFTALNEHDSAGASAERALFWGGGGGLLSVYPASANAFRLSVFVCASTSFVRNL
jgi:hypothetical protein